MQATDDPVLKRFRAELDRVYGETLDRVVLFGSRARGDARPDSDYDVAVFLNRSREFWTESAVLADIGTEILLESGAVINAWPLKSAAMAEPSVIMEAVRREGLDF